MPKLRDLEASEVLAALTTVSAQPGEAVGRLRLSTPQMALPFVITPVLPTFRERHPRVEVEVVVEDRFVDIVAEGYDAGVRLSEAIERDMVHIRLTDAWPAGCERDPVEPGKRISSTDS